MSWATLTKSSEAATASHSEPVASAREAHSNPPLSVSSDPSTVLARKEGHGRVKCVLSGDSVVIWVSGAGSTPVEKQVTLSLLSAPRIARGKDAGQDHPFAWESREFLRHLLISRDVSYRIDFTHPTSGRQYGWVRASDGTNINLAVAKSGWARVQEPRGGKGPRGKDHEELLAAGREAEMSGRGIYTREAGAAERSVRTVTEHFDSREFFERVRSEQPLRGVVEGVLDGSTVRVLLVPSFYSIVCRLSGVQCPLWKREDSSVHARAHAEPTLRVAQPLAPQAKYVTEYCLLNRDVVATIAGVNKDDTYYGTVLYKGKNVAEELLRQGLAKYVPWSASAAEKARFHKLEAAAKSKNAGMWKTAVRSSLAGADFYATVREVRTGSRITVEDETGKVYDAFFSSVIAPKLNPRAPKEDEKMGFESKEYLRKKIIGKRVHMRFDYDKPAQASKVAGDPDAPPRYFFSVYLGKKHLPLCMVEQGLATVITHRREEARSREYSLLLEAEVKAKEEKRGIWSNADIKRVNDMSNIKSAQAKQYIKFLNKKGLQAVVEFMLNPVRLKLYVPSLNCYISFTVAGVRAPWYNPSKSSNDFYGEESIAFARNYLHQRKVEIEVYTSDKGGNFIGALSIKHADRIDYAGVLLEAGAASLSEQADRYPRYEAMKSAQHLAQQHRRGIWQHWKPESEAKVADVDTRPQPEMATLLLTHIDDARTFYCQHVSDEASDTLSRMMAILQETKGTADANYQWKKHQLCAARYEYDGLWYRVRLLQQEGSRLWKVIYVDFGNSAVIGTSQLQPLDSRVAGVPVQAKLCHLSLVHVPTLEDEHGPAAAQLLKDLSWGKVLIASIDNKDPATGAYYVTMGDAATKININKQMVRQGLALVKPTGQPGYEVPLAQLNEEQQAARSSRSGYWVYGDIDLEDIVGEE